MSSSALIPNPFRRAARRFGLTAVVCLVAVLVGVAVGGGAAIVAGSVGGTLAALAAFGAFIALGFAARFDREQAAIDRGEALADWTLSPTEWNTFVGRVHARRPRVSSRKRYREVDAPVRVVLLPTSLRWRGGYVLWDTGTMRLERARFDPDAGWIELTLIVYGPDVRVEHQWLIPVPDAQREAVPALIARLSAGA